MAYDHIEHVILFYRKDRDRSTTKYIRTQDELSRVQWFIENVWNGRFRWDPVLQRIVEVED